MVIKNNIIMENINENNQGDIITETPTIKKRGRPAKPKKIKEPKLIKLPTEIDPDKRIFYYER